MFAGGDVLSYMVYRKCMCLPELVSSAPKLQMNSSLRKLTYGSVQYNSDQILGVGSYGKVYKAKCGQLVCAAKLLHDTLCQDKDANTCDLTQKFELECQFFSKLNHPNIVQYLSTSRDPLSQRQILVMELMDQSLTELLERSSQLLPYHCQLNICHDVALALSYLHSNDIIHRDLSSNNVLLIGEGIRAKVTDFGMSKLIDINPRMTPLSQCPGTAAYMPPEALISPPHYSSKLDCFSYGVLTIQILTTNFPNPSDATATTEDRRYPTGRILVFVPETQRRRGDIELIAPEHPLLPTALNCLKDRDVERASADDLCDEIAKLKEDARYAESLKQDSISLAQHTSWLQKEMAVKYRSIVRCADEIEKSTSESSCSELEEHTSQQVLQACIGRLQKEEERHTQALSRIGMRIEEMKIELELCVLLDQGAQEQVDTNSVTPVSHSGAQEDHDLNFRWSHGERAPEVMSSLSEAVTAHGNTAYFSCCQDIYSYTMPDNSWRKLSSCKYIKFGMVVINDSLTTVGGLQERLLIPSSPTNVLLTLDSAATWEEVLPPMPTKRTLPACITTPTHLLVAGGRGSGNLSTVELLDLKILQWCATESLPQKVGYPLIALLGDTVYLSSHHKKNTNFSCSVERLSQRVHDSSDTRPGWSRIADIPVRCGSGLVSFRGRLLAIGGAGNVYGDYITGTVHSFNPATDSWSTVGSMPTPRYGVLAASLAGGHLVVAGGCNIRHNTPGAVTEIATIMD